MFESFDGANHLETKERKIDLVRKHKVFMLPYELVGSNGRQLKLLSREVEERSYAIWKDMKMNNNKPNKKVKVCGQSLSNG